MLCEIEHGVTPFNQMLEYKLLLTALLPDIWGKRPTRKKKKEKKADGNPITGYALIAAQLKMLIYSNLREEFWRRNTCAEIV